MPKRANRKSHIANRKRKQTEKTKTVSKKVAPKIASQKPEAKSQLTTQVVSLEGKTGSMVLPEEIFKVKVNPNTVAQAVRVYLNNQRAYSGKTKTRSEVSGGGRKPWRQKGTGKARQGSIRAPHWKGGGVAFGPVAEKVLLTLPKKVKHRVLFGVLSEKFEKGEIKIVDNFEKIKPKTSELVKALNKTDLLQQKVLWVVNGDSKNLVRAGRNLPNLSFCRIENLNTFEVLRAGVLVFNREAINKLRERVS